MESDDEDHTHFDFLGAKGVLIERREPLGVAIGSLLQEAVYSTKQNSRTQGVPRKVQEYNRYYPRRGTP